MAIGFKTDTQGRLSAMAVRHRHRTIQFLIERRSFTTRVFRTLFQRKLEKQNGAVAQLVER